MSDTDILNDTVIDDLDNLYKEKKSRKEKGTAGVEKNTTVVYNFKLQKQLLFHFQYSTSFQYCLYDQCSKSHTYFVHRPRT